MQFLDDLNDAQRRATTADDGPVVIVAGPGTGKTKTLTARIAYLLASGRAQPDQVLALTFTKKAAQEMQTRATMLLHGSTKQPTITTFHALCHSLLGGQAVFIDEPARLQVIRSLPRLAKYKGLSARELGLLISRAKNLADDDQALGKVVAAYEVALAEANMIDFDDLLVRTRDLLQRDEAKRHELGQRFTHILVDEFQDTNRLQYEILRLLCSNANLFVIGDPLQSIYGFRGASGGIFEQFQVDYPSAQTVTLTTNYRSAPQIVGLSNAIFPQSLQLRPHITRSGEVRAVEVLNEYSEAAWVASEIQRLIGGGDLLHAVSDDAYAAQVTLQDIAILYRNRSVAKTVQKVVSDSGLPYQVVGDGSPYDQPQIQAIMALLRACHRADQTPPQGFNAAQWQEVLRLVHDSQQPDALAERARRIMGYELTPALQQFLGNLVQFHDLDNAVAHFDELAAQDFYDPTADAITLLTIHASKGLEFPHVFLIGCEDGSLPHRTADFDEERRLFFVAATRAMQGLTVTHTRRRGSNQVRISPFLNMLSDDILPRIIDPNIASDQRHAQKRAIKRSQQSLF